MVQRTRAKKGHEKKRIQNLRYTKKQNYDYFVRYLRWAMFPAFNVMFYQRGEVVFCMTDVTFKTEGNSVVFLARKNSQTAGDGAHWFEQLQSWLWNNPDDIVVRFAEIDMVDRYLECDATHFELEVFARINERMFIKSISFEPKNMVFKYEDYEV